MLLTGIQEQSDIARRRHEEAMKAMQRQQATPTFGGSPMLSQGNTGASTAPQEGSGGDDPIGMAQQGKQYYDWYNKLSGAGGTTGGGGTAGGSTGSSWASFGPWAALAAGVIRTTDDIGDGDYGIGDALTGRSLNMKYGDSLGGAGKYIFPDTGKLDFLNLGDKVNDWTGTEGDGGNALFDSVSGFFDGLF